VEPLPWSLAARWTGVPTPYATLTSGSSAVTIEFDDGAVWLSGAAALPLSYAGEELSLRVAVDSDDGMVLLGDLAALPVRGALEDVSSGATLLTLGGTPGALRVSGEVPTA